MVQRDCKREVVANAEAIRRLHARVHETFRNRGAGPEARREWQEACAALHAQYDALAFPGGYRDAPDRIAAGDADAVEAALRFLEVRPTSFGRATCSRSSCAE